MSRFVLKSPPNDHFIIIYSLRASETPRG